jgi:hypothetical protein
MEFTLDFVTLTLAVLVTVVAYLFYCVYTLAACYKSAKKALEMMVTAHNDLVVTMFDMLEDLDDLHEDEKDNDNG